MDVRGQVAIVTGAARGLGKEYAKGLLQHGAKVAISDVLEAEGQQTVADFAAEYGSDRVIFVKTDVSKQKDVEEMFATVASQLGPLRVIINNAAVSSEFVSFDKVVDIGLTGLMRCTYMALKILRKDEGGPGGVIINIGSIVGVEIVPAVSSSSYIATKHGVVALTRTIGEGLSFEAEEGVDHGVRLACLCPGYARTMLMRNVNDTCTADTKGRDIWHEAFEKTGGWVDHAHLVRACLSLIEQDHEQGAIVTTLGGGVTQYRYPEHLRGKSALL